MTSLTTDAPPLCAAARASRPEVRRGCTSTLEKIRAVALLTLVSALWLAPASIIGGTRGTNLVWESAYSPLVQGALLVLLMSVVERRADPGLARTLALAGVAILASVLAGIAEGITLPAIGVWTGQTPFLVSFWANLGTLMAMAICFVVIYDYRFRLRYRRQAINDMRLRRARLVRETVESQLQAMQARVDPQFLFDAMACVERTYARDSARGDLLLDDLIAYLRAVLPDLRSTTSTLARELALGRAYVDISAMMLGRPVVLAIEAPATADAIAFPPMCVVPVVQFLLAGGAGDGPLALTLRVRVSPQALVLEARAPNGPADVAARDAEALAAMRQRMQDLHRERMRLTVSTDAATGRSVSLEIPHDRPDSRDSRG